MFRKQDLYTQTVFLLQALKGKLALRLALWDAMMEIGQANFNGRENLWTMVRPRTPFQHTTVQEEGGTEEKEMGMRHEPKNRKIQEEREKEN